ncbi:MAG: hypothetical protein ABSF47_01385 [Minisyncoccia bacterium]|jgi:hypothetical protein
MSILIASPLIFLLPGYAITLAMPWVRRAIARLGYALVTSVALGVVVSSGAAYAKFPLGASLFASLVAVTLLFGLAFRRRITQVAEEWRDMARAEWLFLGFALLIAVAAAVFIAVPHFNYPWPSHGDEWWSVGTVQNLLSGKSINTHPYLPIDFPDYKPGFYSYIASVLNLVGADPVSSWAFLPALNVFLVSFVASLFLFGQTKRSFAGLLLPVFLVALRSDINILGWWFFVPSMFAFFFILPLLFGMRDWLRSSSGLGWAALALGALFLVYLPFGVLAVFALALSAVFILDKRRRIFMLVVILFLIAAGVVMGMALSPYQVYWQIANFHFSSPLAEKFVSSFFVPAGATVPDPRHAFLGFLGLPILVLAVIGAWCVRKEKWMYGVLTAFAMGALNLVLLWITDVSFLVFYQRNFYLLGVMAAVLAVFGLDWLIGKTMAIRFFKNIVAARFLVPIIITAVAICWMFAGYFKLPAGAQLYYLVDRENLAATQWLRAQPELKGKTVLADEFTGSIITPLTGLYSKLSLLTSQNIQSVINPLDSLFFLKSCDIKKDIIRRLAADIVYSRMPLDCPFLKEIYSSTSTFIYSTEITPVPTE